MAASTDKYVPILISERLRPNDVGKFTLCRAAALLMGVGSATNGEFFTNENGTIWGPKQIANNLERMMRATGEPKRDGYNQSHMDDFLRGVGFDEEAWRKYNKPMFEIKAKLKTNHVVFLAGDVKHTPALSPLRKYVNPNVGHEIILTDISNDGTRVWFIDPMTPHGTGDYERSAPIDHFRKFGSEFKEGKNYNAGIMKKGYLSRANIARRQRDRLKAIVLAQEQTILGLGTQSGVDDEHLLTVELALAACQSQDSAAQVTDLVARLERIADIATG